MEYCTYRSILTVKRTKKDHGSSKDGPEEQRGRTGDALCWERVQCCASAKGEREEKLFFAPRGRDKIIIMFV